MHRISHNHSQQGIALFVALIFMVVLTLIGLAAFNNNTLQARMSYAATETNFAFQSAETGLTAGETWLVNQTDRPLPDCVVAANTTTNDNACIYARASAIEAGNIPLVTRDQINSETFWLNNGRQFGYTYPASGAATVITGQEIPNTNAPPRYIIEDLGVDTSGSVVKRNNKTYQVYYFQVTARGFGANSNAQTVVQSVYAQGY